MNIENVKDEVNMATDSTYGKDLNMSTGNKKP